MTTLQVHAFDWIIRDHAGDNAQAIIDCWALDQHSEPYFLRITNFPIFCMIELPRFIKNQKFEHQWTNYEKSILINEINKLLSYKEDTQKLVSGELLKLHKLYYYEGNDKTPFIRAFFNNVKDMKACKYKLDNAFQSQHFGWIKCNVWEDNIDCVRKLLTIKNIKYSKWFQVVGKLVEEDDKKSTVNNEYIIDWQTMSPIDDEVSKTWFTNPSILSWDIETYSDNHLAMPDKYNDKHVAYMISCIYKRYKIANTLKRFGIIIGDCNQIPKEKLDKCTLIHVNNEVELVDAFAKIVEDTDADILIGYNILGYDYPYLDHRLKREIKNWPSSMSRMIGEIPKMTTNNWASKAYGHQALNTLNMSGRISIDLLPVVKRDHKLESYKLDYVSEKFINKKKHDVSAQDMFKIFEDMQIAVANHKQHPTHETAQILDKVKDEMTKVMLYCIQDSELVIELMENLDVWVGMVELSNIVGVTIVEIFTKGQQVRCLSQLYDIAAKRGFVLNGRETPTYSFKGGSVQKPIPGLYDCIICLDFKSLYPSIIQAFNMCYTTLIAPEHYNVIPDADCHVIEFDQELEKVKTKPNEMEDDFVNYSNDSESDEFDDEEKVEELTVMHYKIKFYKHKEGLLPALVRNLVAERNNVRRLQKNEKNPLVWMVLEKRQLALKVSANSFFGFLGVQENGKMPCMEAAMSITAKGRELIAAVGTYLYDKYNAKIVYGDSVTHDTPILVRKHGTAFYIPIANIGKDWSMYHHTKEASECHYEVWTEKGWTKIIRVIRHLTNKDIYRVETSLGHVNVTSDHSLLDNLGNKIKPTELQGDTKLLHTPLFPDIVYVVNNNVREAQQWYAQFNNIIKEEDTIIKSITYIGNTKEYVYDLETENHHFCAGVGCIVVHNTDSVMIDVNIKDRKECRYWGELLSQEISGVKVGDLLPGQDDLKHTEAKPGLFFSPLEMEFEKAMLLFCIKPKMYAYYCINKKGLLVKKKDSEELELNSKGIPLVRRDKIKLLKYLYGTILNMIMNGDPFRSAICLLIDTLQDLIDNKIDYNELKSSRELNAHYKQPSFYMKVFSDELKKKQKMVNPGDRLEFLVILNPEVDKLGQRMVLVEDYKESLKTDTPLKIDYLYYIEHAMSNPLDTIMSIGYSKTLNKLNISYKPGRKRNPITIQTPCELLYHLIANNQNLMLVKENILAHLDRIENPKLRVVKM